MHLYVCNASCKLLNAKPPWNRPVIPCICIAPSKIVETAKLIELLLVFRECIHGNLEIRLEFFSRLNVPYFNRLSSVAYHNNIKVSLTCCGNGNSRRLFVERDWILNTRGAWVDWAFEIWVWTKDLWPWKFRMAGIVCSLKVRSLREAN